MTVDADMLVAQLAALGGEPLPAGRTRIALAPGEACHAVIRGSVDLFFHPANGWPALSIAQLPPGALIPGGATVAAGAFIALPGMGAEVRRYPIDVMAAAEDTRQQATALFVQAVAGALPPGHTQPIQLPELFDALAAAALAKVDDQRRRIAAHTESLERQLRSGIASLAHVLNPAAEGQIPVAGSALLRATLKAVANAGLAEMPAADVLIQADRDPQPVTTLARRCNFSTRAIRLEGEWWREDHGALVVFVGAERRPCALLVTADSRYRLWDPDLAVERILTPVLARAVQADAIAVFPPLPGGRFTAAQIVRFALHQSRRDGWRSAWITLWVGLMSLAGPIMTGYLVDSVIPMARMEQLIVMTSVLTILAVSSMALGLLQSFALLRIEGRATYRVQNGVWNRLLRMPAAFFRRFSVGDMVNRAQGVDDIRTILTGLLTGAFGHAVAGLFSLLLMLWYQWKLGFLLLATVIVYAFIVYYLGRLVRSKNVVINQLRGRHQGLLFQLLGGVRKLRIAGAEKMAFARWAALYGELNSINFQQGMLDNWATVLKAMFSPLMMIVLLAAIGFMSGTLFVFATPTGWHQISDNLIAPVIDIGRFVSFNAAAGIFMGSVFGLSALALQLLNVAPLWGRVEPILEEELESETGSEDPGRISGRIEVANVTFRYSPAGPNVLDDVSFHAEPGEFIALVGPSGAGKSTFVRILLGFEKPSAGSVFIDQMDMARLDKAALRRQYGAVLQNARLLSGSIFHNIATGADVTREEVMEAARLTGLDRDIARMPMGLDTFVAENGTTLSGGQRQRLMISRAVIRKPKVLIFDEATSALDNETQALVSKGVDELRCTRIVIAHRLSTVVHADRIYVLDRGHIVESGTYADLMQRHGFFADLVERQIV